MNFKTVTLLLIISVHQVTPFFLTLVATLYSAYQVVNDAHDTYSKFTPGKTRDPSNAEVIKSIQNVTKQISEVSDRLSTKIEDAVENLLKEIPRAIEIQSDLRQMAAYVQRINYLYEKLLKLMRKGKKMKKADVKKYTKAAISYSNEGVDGTLNGLHKLLAPKATAHLKEGILALLGQQLQNVREDRICGKGKPPSQQYLDIFETVITTEIRGFVCEAYGYLLLERFGKGSYADEIDDSKDRAVSRIKEYSKIFSRSEKGTSKIYDSCDPVDPERGTTFYEFTNFISPYFINQASLNSESNCDSKCEAEDFPVTDINCHEEDEICKNTQLCLGNIIECSSQWGELNICLSDETPETRRYAYYKNNTGTIYGNRNRCPGWQTPVETWNIGQSECLTCLCTCVEDRYTSKNLWVISLREQLTDFKNNKFLTGVRFNVTPNVAHIQIQQGQLGVDGQFASESIEWKSVENIRFDSEGSMSKKKIIFHVDTDDEEERLTVDRDYAVLSWEQRTIYFDNIVVPDGYVVTGCRFNHPSDNKGAIQLEVHATPYDFSTSQAIIDDDNPSIWVTPDDMKGNDDDPNYDRDRDELKLEGPLSDPTEVHETVEVHSKPNTFMKVMHTSLEKDAGGTVIPLMEALDVAGNPAFLLEGISLVYKYADSTKGAGLMALRLQGVDVLKYLDINFSEEDESEEDSSETDSQTSDASSTDSSE